MKIRNGKYGHQRRAISPIIATVLIIAVTLIAAVAIGGFVFGIFGSASQTAQISVTSSALVSSYFQAAIGGPLLAPTCTATPGTDTLTLTNTGTASASVSSITINWAGSANSIAAPAACTVTASGDTAGNPLVLTFPTAQSLLVAKAVQGQTYQGTITLSNGAIILFTGTWE